MNARRFLPRFLPLAGAFGAGIFSTLLAMLAVVPLLRPPPTETTDIGRTVLMQLDQNLEWHPAGPAGDGMSLWGPPGPNDPPGAHPPAVLSVLPDGEDRVRVYLYGTDVSDRLSATDHAELRKVLALRGGRRRGGGVGEGPRPAGVRSRGTGGGF